MIASDLNFMEQALLCAHKAAQCNEVPIGAVLVAQDEIIAQGWNQPISTNDPTAHAEIMVLRAAAQRLKNYRLTGTTLYVTLEPCSMCAGAIIQARIQRVVFGAFDPRAGAVGSVVNIFDLPELNHRVDYVGGVLSEPSGTLLRDFFQARRK